VKFAIQNLRMVSEAYRHYLITRFNLRREGWNTARDGSLVLTEEWLSNRFVLFERFCLASLQNQTNQNFTWLTYFDINTPQEYQQKINGYNFHFPNFKPVFINGMPEFLSSIQTEIKKNSQPFTITTRIDNDDCVSKNFINEIQKNFEEQEFLVLDFPDGYTLQINPEIKIGKRKQLFNPFISLIEKSEGAESVWSRETHSSWKKEKNVKRINHKRIWMSVIHFENKENSYAGFGKVNLKLLLNEFALDYDIQLKLINKKRTLAEHLESFQNKVSSYWRTFYKDIKRKAGLYK
jgi:hypothetical protein